MYWRLKLRESHLLFTALAHVSISSYTSVAAALCLKLLCMSARDDVPTRRCQNCCARLPVNASRGCGYTNTNHKVQGL